MKKMNAREIRYILATDVGSTTTKARFFKRIGEEYRYVISGEAPTTVEEPYEDVTLGVRNAVREIEELTGHKLLDEGGIIIPGNDGRGVDIYCTTSSAGGGLQMMVAGVVKSMTAESAERAALGAGAIVMDVIAIDDGREDYERIRRIRSLRPDMILVAGGIDGGTVSHVMEIADLIKSAEPKPRLGMAFKLPVIFGGNINAREKIKDSLGDLFDLTTVDNLRPTLEIENTEPARIAVHNLFMEHVMSHAPGYRKLMKWTEVSIMPTPAGEGVMMQSIANNLNTNVLGVGLGGATTNVYSIVEGRFVRSVSANLGMSYSICNVLKEAGISNIMRWLPFDVSEKDIENRLVNKMIRPTTIPQTLEELILEHAVAREALRLGLEHHKNLARGLKGVKRERTMDLERFRRMEEATYITMMKIDVIAGTGGLLSHAPRRSQSLLILIDALQPEGVTRLFKDSVFMMPHLGILSTVHKDAAWEIFVNDCLVRLGTVIAPKGLAKPGDEVLTVTLEMPDGSTREERLRFGELKRIQLGEKEKAKALIDVTKFFDAGLGLGHKLDTTVEGGVVGVVIDARGRPLKLPEDNETRKAKIAEWFRVLESYPESFLKELCDI